MYSIGSKKITSSIALGVAIFNLPFLAGCAGEKVRTDTTSLVPSNKPAVPKTEATKPQYELITEGSHIVEHRVKEAKHTLFVVDVIHQPPNNVQGTAPYDTAYDQLVLKLMETSEKNANEFAQKHNLTMIAGDAVTQQYADNFNQMLPMFRKMLSNSQVEAQITGQSPQLASQWQAIKRDYYLNPLVRTVFDNPAFQFLSLENPEYIAQAQQASSEADFRLANEKREDAILESVSQRAEKNILIMMGASHSFIENIQDWNDAHPDKKIQLIEVRLTGIPKDRSKISTWAQEYK